MKEYQVRVTMTVKANSQEEAAKGAMRWLPWMRELPLGSSDGITLTGVAVEAASADWKP